jgi:hypothetical protein
MELNIKLNLSNLKICDRLLGLSFNEPNQQTLCNLCLFCSRNFRWKSMGQRGAFSSNQIGLMGQQRSPLSAVPRRVGERFTSIVITIKSREIDGYRLSSKESSYRSNRHCLYKYVIFNRIYENYIL